MKLNVVDGFVKAGLVVLSSFMCHLPAGASQLDACVKAFEEGTQGTLLAPEAEASDYLWKEVEAYSFSMKRLDEHKVKVGGMIDEKMNALKQDLLDSLAEAKKGDEFYEYYTEKNGELFVKDALEAKMTYTLDSEREAFILMDKVIDLFIRAGMKPSDIKSCLKSGREMHQCKISKTWSDEKFDSQLTLATKEFGRRAEEITQKYNQALANELYSSEFFSDYFSDGGLSHKWATLFCQRIQQVK